MILNSVSEGCPRSSSALDVGLAHCGDAYERSSYPCTVCVREPG